MRDLVTVRETCDSKRPGELLNVWQSHFPLPCFPSLFGRKTLALWKKNPCSLEERLLFFGRNTLALWKKYPCPLEERSLPSRIRPLPSGTRPLPLGRKTLAQKKAKDAKEANEAAGEKGDPVRGHQVEPGLYIQPGDDQKEVDGKVITARRRSCTKTRRGSPVGNRPSPC